MENKKIEEVAILLATYQGERFLEEQIDSLFEQTYKNWKLYIHDDGSDDKTVEILQRYKEQYPEQIVLLDGNITGGPKTNFLYMMKQVESAYYMCCDQDDIWLPEKIEKTYNQMKSLETDVDIPCLVFTELKIVNEDLEVISDTMSRYQKLDCVNTNLHRMLMQNVVTGCTMMLNRKLRDMVIQYKDIKNIIMHDWWASIIAAEFGKIKFIEEPTILYRQHDDNNIGALDINNVSYFLKKLSQFKDNKEAVKNTQIQAKEMVETFNMAEDSLPAKLASCLTLSKVKRLMVYWKNDFKKNGLARTLGLIIWG